MSFDEKISGAELLRKNITKSVSKKRRICTIVSITNFCAINGPYGYKCQNYPSYTINCLGLVLKKHIMQQLI